MYEVVVNYFSYVVDDSGMCFLINFNQKYFFQICVLDFLLLDVNDFDVLDCFDVLDIIVWGLYGLVYWYCFYVCCVMYVYLMFFIVLVCLVDSILFLIDQNIVMFFNCIVVDENFGGLVFEDEGVCCVVFLMDFKKKVMIMGNYGIFVLGDSIVDMFNWMYYFE